MEHVVYHAPGGGTIHAVAMERDANYEQAMTESGTKWRVTLVPDEELPGTLVFYHHLDPKNPEHSARLAVQHLSPPNLHMHHMNGGQIVPLGQQAQIGGGIAGAVATRAEVDALRRAISELMAGQSKLIEELKAARAPAAASEPAAGAPGMQVGDTTTGEAA